MSTFYQDVVKKSAHFSDPSRVSSLDLLEPVTRQKVLDIVAEARKSGLNLMVYETYRSSQRQKKLFKEGASKLETVGVHHFGLAADLVKDVNGEPSWKGDFSLLGKLAKKHGLIWGGDWGDPKKHHTFIDAVHVQRCSLARQKALFDETFYPDAAYDPYDD